MLQQWGSLNNLISLQKENTEAIENFTKIFEKM